MRVFKYTVPIVSQVRGRVLEVPVEEGNRLVKKGEVLFRIDPTPYQLEVNTLEAQLVNAQGSDSASSRSQAKGAAAKIDETRGAIAQAASRRARSSASSSSRASASQQYRELVEDRRRQPLRPRARRDRRRASSEGQLDAARSAEAQARAEARPVGERRSSRSSAPR